MGTLIPVGLQNMHWVILDHGRLRARRSYSPRGFGYLRNRATAMEPCLGVISYFLAIILIITTEPRGERLIIFVTYGFTVLGARWTSRLRLGLPTCVLSLPGTTGNHVRGRTRDSRPR